MNSLLGESIDVLLNSSAIMIAYLIWPFLLLEFPRYLLLSFVATIMHRPKNVVLLNQNKQKFTVLLAGHNECQTLRSTVQSLWEQSVVPNEILVVSDGSTDKTRILLAELQNENLIHGAHHLDLRGGKAAAMNLISQFAKYELLVIVDCDSSLHRFAFANIIKPFTDPRVGAVCGNLTPMNPKKSLLGTMQAIEYLISLSLGRFSMEAINQLTCVSGAFGCYRKSALREADGLDAVSGEDFDVTLRLRKKGWQIRFAEDALCFTRVPKSFDALVAQRNRWEGDCIGLRFGKHAHLSNPFSKRFNAKELFHQIEFLIFNVLSSVATPFYIIWLWNYFGEAAPMLGLGAYLILGINDLLMFSIAIAKIRSINSIWLLPYIPLYSIFNSTFLRFSRLNAYSREILFNASKADTFVPAKVRNSRVALS